VAKKKAVQKKAAPRRAAAGPEKSEPAQDAGQAEQTAKPAGQEGKPEGKRKKERPVRCIHRHADVEFRRAFPKVCKKLIDKAAEDASVAHTRLLLQIGEFDKPKKKQQQSGPSLSAMLFAELKRRQDEREAALDGDAGAVSPESAAATTEAEGATSEDAEKR